MQALPRPSLGPKFSGHLKEQQTNHYNVRCCEMLENREGGLALTVEAVVRQEG